MSVEQLLFDIAEALRVPVLVVAVVALGVVAVEAGALLVELARRRSRGLARLDRVVGEARRLLAAHDPAGALAAVRRLAFNREMAEVVGVAIEERARADRADRIAKRLADYDYRLMRRLERTRILVRLGPAVGLMGTLIPLSPALAGLARGDVEQLTRDLRVAFSVTVAGLLVGMVAFAISLVRDRVYAQDYSDVEYVTVALGATDPAEAKAA